MMELYPTILDKVALAVESAKVAKEVTIDIEGFGEDLNFNLFCWKDAELRVVAQLSTQYMLDKEDRLERLIRAACILRQGWEATAFTFVAEGYCSMDEDVTRGRELAEVFVETDAAVKECLSFTHIEGEDGLFVAVPYSYTPPRKVIFDEPLRYRGRTAFRDQRYPAALARALALDVTSSYEDIDVDQDTFHKLLAFGLQDLGFMVNYR